MTPPRAATGSPTVVGRVVDGGHIPATTPNQFLMTPARTGGPIVEGGAYASSSTGDTSLAFTVLGGPAPGVGELVVVRRVGGRWVAVSATAGATPNTTFTGDVASFCFNLRVDSDVEITRDSDSAVLWTGTTSTLAGYSDSIALSADTAVTVDVAPPTPRLAAASYSFTMHAGVPNYIPPIVLPRATGFYCAEFCAYPIGPSVTYLHRASGTTATLTKATPSSNWSGSAATPDGMSTVNITYTGIVLNGVIGVGGGGSGFTTQHLFGGKTCFDGTNPFKVTYSTFFGTVGGGFGFGDLIDITE